MSQKKVAPKAKKTAAKPKAKAVVKSAPKTPAKAPAKAKPAAKAETKVKPKAKPVAPPAKAKAIFFDRDGVVNGSPGEGSYVLSWWDFQFVDDVAEVLTYLKKKGWLLIMVTNQQCVGKGIITMAQLDAIHERMQAELGPAAAFDAIYVSPHLKSENSPMRKPAPGMVLAAAEKFNIDLKASWLVGDHDRDIELARNAGVGTAVRFMSEKEVKIRAEYTVHSHQELLKLFKSKL
jgi:histidinol-phosphate phosphatase family protein